ncbi:MAG TPA: NnrU protein, partial [Deltaproteobacteria bacterium]|nr:NnrU protein [Deltaproteobacteria bacterium]
SGWVRPRLVSALGETRFQWLYTTQAIVMLSLTWYAWDLAPFVELWRPAPWTRWVPNIGMPFVCILIWAGYTTESPTIAGKEEALSNERVATGVLRITRHPANMGFILWGLLHLFANGDLATVLLILSFVGLGVLGTWHIERRRLARHGNAWLAYAKETSVVPFAAILRGDQHLAVGEMGWKPIAGGLALWLVLLLTHHHEWFAGKSPMPFF